MEHGRLRGTHHPRTAQAPIDLGQDPPLSVDGEPGGLVSRRRVSLQWLSGTVLTGLCGAALMGGAVFASLDGETRFASVPDRFEGLLRSGIGSTERIARKGDRLPVYSEPAVTRHVIRISTTARIGNREVVRVRPYVRVAGNLSLSVSELTANLPPYNPQRLLAESDPDTRASAAEAAGAGPDAEVSFVMRDLAALLPRLRLAHAVAPDQALADVRAALGAGGAPPALAGAAGPRLAYAAEGSADPYAGFAARIVPENVTLLPKTTTQTTGGNPWNERVVAARRGDTAAALLQELGAAGEDAKAVAAVLAARGLGGPLPEGTKLRVLLAPVNAGQQMKPVRVVVASESAVEAVVAFSDTGRYVAVDVQTATAEVADTGEEADDGTGVRLYQSLYETGLRDQVPRSVIDDVVRIYSFDIDFQRRVQPGDSFEILYAAEDDNNDADGRAEVLFAALTIAGESRRVYRFMTPDDGIVDYYDESGKSAKKFLVRKPLADGMLRSGFGFRRHPLLRYVKMHTGVDWAAPRGTPIYAAGNGIVEKAGWESGYGKYVRIRHNNGYQTAYAHMTGFARGIEEGVRVRQGQVIGYVGSTGLSAGPHLHYEILVNGRYVDPMRIRLPRGRSLEGQALASFERERDRIDELMARPAMRTAQNQAR